MRPRFDVVDVSARRFWPLFAIQTASVGALVYLALPAFVAIADSPGRTVDFPPRRVLAMLAVMAVFHAAYWSRLRWAALPAMPTNTALNHGFLFLSRLSFIFGAAFFSLVSFRHLPALANAPDALAMTARGALLLAMLFCLFCYSLEIERIGRATDVQAEGEPGDDR